jgi:hypothetical protein
VVQLLLAQQCARRHLRFRARCALGGPLGLGCAAPCLPAPRTPSQLYVPQ